MGNRLENADADPTITASPVAAGGKETSTMTTITTAADLCNILSDLTGIRTLTIAQARDAMHARGWTRYESLTGEQLGLLADDILSGWSFEDEVWINLSCGARVLMRQGRPVRVSDGGHNEMFDSQIREDLEEIGWAVTIGEWSVGDEHDATAPVNKAVEVRWK